jgi:two-component system, NarL family, nitrate/nitrite response regulator NarL
VHVKAIFRKIRVQNRTQAAIWAMNCRLFDAEMNDGSAASVRAESSNARAVSFLPKTLSAMPTRWAGMCRIGHRSTGGPLC